MPCLRASSVGSAGLDGLSGSILFASSPVVVWWAYLVALFCTPILVVIFFLIPGFAVATRCSLYR